MYLQWIPNDKMSTQPSITKIVFKKVTVQVSKHSYGPLVNACTTCHFQQNETSLCAELLYLDRMVIVFIPRGVYKDRIYGVFI